MSEDLKKRIFSLIAEYLEKKPQKDAIPPKSFINYAGPIYDEDEICNMVDAILSGWFALGTYTKKFEEELAKICGVNHCVYTNSGSSANLLAVSALMSKGVSLVKKGDEVITSAVAYPTTINPLIQNGLRPVLVDLDLTTYTLNVEEIEKSLSKKTKLIMLPHLLGSPNDIDAILEIVVDNDLILIEDCCDALGTTYRDQQVGSFGSLGTFSFYAAHQITTGEGGCVITNNEDLSETVRSIRDAGKITSNPKHIPPIPWGKLPEDYDRRYVYTNIGYSLRPVDFQAAMGLMQIKKIPEFINRRNENFKQIFDELTKLDKYFFLPHVVPNGKASWYAFPITVRPDAPFTRNDIVSWLEKNFIETRPFFAGNIMHQPGYLDVDFRTISKLQNSDLIMRNTFFIGVFPGLNAKKIDFIMEKFQQFIMNL
jgi:CDP-6-deoxy-D-xylo-4-hexulose-3-dehydrase|tara:strand:- start:223 stop:1500 length:1278 start_codon:yes stop_codon:yes gene_type:complete